MGCSFEIQEGITVTTAFQKILDKSARKLNKICVDKGSEVYNRSMKSWLEDDSIEIYSTHNEGKSIVIEKSTKTLKSKIYKHMTLISNNVYNDKLDDIVNQYNSIYHQKEEC